MKKTITMSSLPKDQHMWNAFIFFAFPVMIVGAYVLIERLIGIRNIGVLSVFDITIMSLATFRIIRLITFDKIFSFARVMFMDTLPDGTEVKPAGGFRRAAAELMECFWCTGVWVGLFVLVLYMLTPIGRFGALILAIAALGSFFQVVSRRVGGTT